MGSPAVRPLITSTGPADGSARIRRSTASPLSSEIGVMPSRMSASTTPSFSPMPAPDHTDHSSARARACGLRRPKSTVSSDIQSLAVA